LPESFGALSNLEYLYDDDDDDDDVVGMAHTKYAKNRVSAIDTPISNASH
jgi:hypothetical protein